MKVLLVGEYSKLHNNLRHGLRNLGIDVHTANFGDSFKKFKSDIKLYHVSTNKKMDWLRCIYSKYLYQRFIQYDVVQFINEKELGIYDGFHPKLGIKIAENAKLSVLLLAGCNYQYYVNGKNVLGISPCEECMKYDGKNNHSCIYKFNNYIRKTSCTFQKRVDVIVPMTYEYYMCNRNSEFSYKMSQHIPMPIISDGHCSIRKGKKLVILHPLNREGFKGTKMIRKAFAILEKKYSDVAEFIIDGQMPYTEYMKLVERADILVDQKNGITYGMAALDAMKNGKILITGNNRKIIDIPVFNYLHEAPAFELGMTVGEIVENISAVINMQDQYAELAKRGVEFVDNYFNADNVAKKFLDLYEKELYKKQKLK